MAMILPTEVMLQPYVECLWVGRRQPAAGREPVLPTGVMHIAIRLEGGDVQLYDDVASSSPLQSGDALVAGARASPYWKDASVATLTIGAQLRPGSARALFGVSAAELCGRHVTLDDVWGEDGRRLREALHEAADARARVAVLQTALVARLTTAVDIHPSVTEMLARLHAAPSMERLPVVEGISERHFIARFRDATGLSPKRYARVRRFQHLLSMLRAEPNLSLAELATQAGYSDQSHCNRDFVELSGTTPHVWRLQLRSRQQSSTSTDRAEGQFCPRPAPPG